jgi:hypothetical protein
MYFLTGTVKARLRPEVGNLEHPGPAVHEQVVRFEVALQHPAAMNEGDALTQLIHHDL